MAKPTTPTTDASIVTAIDAAAPETKVVKSAYLSATPKKLSEVEVDKLDANGLLDYATTVNTLLGRLVKAGVIVDPRNGIIYVAGNVAGNANNRQSHKLLPSVFKPNAKKNEVNASGDIILADHRFQEMQDALNGMLSAAVRFAMAPHEGNGVNIQGASGKGVREQFTAICGFKGGSC